MAAATSGMIGCFFELARFFARDYQVEIENESGKRSQSLARISFIKQSAIQTPDADRPHDKVQLVVHAHRPEMKSRY